MSHSSSQITDSDTSMFTANSTLTGEDSSFDISGNLTDITADKSFLIDLTAQHGAGESASAEKEESLFGNVGSKYKSTPLKKGSGDVKVNLDSDSVSFISKEKGEDDQKHNEMYGKRKWKDSDDTVILITDDSHSDSPSDFDTSVSVDDESDSYNDRKGQPVPSSTTNNKVANIDDNLPPTVTLLKNPDGSKVYIVGTAHFSEESQNDVSKIIQSVQPHIVMVELCSQRINILQLDEKTILEEAKNINFQKIREIVHQNGVFNGLVYILLLNLSAQITKQLGMAPGGEFRKALQEVKNIPHCIIHFGDRPINITMHRALSALSWWQTVRLVWHLLNTKDISKEEVERCKQKDLLTEMLAEMAGEFPALERVFVRERDVYLTHSLQIAAASKAINGPMRVVGVVGIGHLQGILDNWGKVTSKQIPPIMRIPPPTMSSKVIKVSFKIAFVGLIIFAGYKVIPKKWLP